MSKRAEDAWVLYEYCTHPKRDNRTCYMAAYEQAEKDTIERAISVLVNLPSLVIPSNYIAYFREKMLEEE